MAIGIALDSLYSHHHGLLPELDLHRILTLLEDLGFVLYHTALSWLEVAKSLREFQEHLGGELCIPLLAGVGRKTELQDIDTVQMKRCINLLAERAARKTGAPAQQTAAGKRLEK